ncbi:glycosyltransferase [Priestia megaterium]|uniref:glycosyltransferase n=1 Tax=Priestia megaterium TaxID=1404 RepID=UPI003CF922E7
MSVLMCEYLNSKTVFQVGSHYFAKNFHADGYNVKWVNQPKTVFNSLVYKKNIIEENLSNDFLSERFEEFYPKVFLPYCKYPILNSKFWANNYMNFFPNKDFSQLQKQEIDLLWMTNVKMFKLSDKIKYRFMIHRMADDFSGFKGAYKNLIYLQDRVIEKSNLVVVTAKNLLDIAYKKNKNVIYLPNGVDTARFNENKYLVPEEYKNLNRPIIVYVGAIEEWFDYELINKSASILKEYAFVIIGNTNDKIKEVFKENENIYLLGKKNHNEIPSYLVHADVGIMPFVDNKLTNSIHPLKLYEYFAAGLPVVSRKLEEVNHMNSPAQLYENQHEFVGMLKELVEEKTNKEELSAYAESNTWNNRYKQLKQFIKS